MILTALNNSTTVTVGIAHFWECLFPIQITQVAPCTWCPNNFVCGEAHLRCLSPSPVRALKTLSTPHSNLHMFRLFPLCQAVHLTFY